VTGVGKAVDFVGMLEVVDDEGCAVPEHGFPVPLQLVLRKARGTGEVRGFSGGGVGKDDAAARALVKKGDANLIHGDAGFCIDPECIQGILDVQAAANAKGRLSEKMVVVDMSLHHEAFLSVLFEHGQIVTVQLVPPAAKD